jgi:hypothetical protein
MGLYDHCASLSGTLSLQVVEGGTKDYTELDNLPTINGVLVKGDLTSKDLKITGGCDAQIDPGDDEHIILSN